MQALTNAEIHDRAQLEQLSRVLHHSAVFTDILNTSEAEHFLVISVNGKHFVKIMVYPLMEDAAIKITIEGEQISDDVLVALGNLAARVNIIHSSGFTFQQNRLVYEIYLAKTMAFQQFEDVQQEFMKLDAIDRVSLEEINPTNPSTSN